MNKLVDKLYKYKDVDGYLFCEDCKEETMVEADDDYIEETRHKYCESHEGFTAMCDGTFITDCTKNIVEYDKIAVVD